MWRTGWGCPPPSATTSADRDPSSASSASTVRAVYVSAGEEVNEGDKLVRLANGQTVEAGLDGRVNAVSVAEGDPVAAGAAQLLRLCKDYDFAAVE